MEEIASSDEGKEEDEDGEDNAPDGEDEHRPQPNQASTKGRHTKEPTAAGADQAETTQAASPPPRASSSSDPSDPAAAPLA